MPVLRGIGILACVGFCLQYRSSQNPSRNVVCTLRIGLAVVGSPNWALLTIVFQLGNVTWFNALVASIRKSAFKRSLKRNVRPRPASKVNCAGPMMEFLPAFPHWAAAGAV